MKITLKQIENAFFDAMAAGYAQGAPKIKVPKFPGSKAIPFVSGDFRVLDFYMVTNYSEHSSGITTIWYQDQPVWIMHYGGWYHKSVIPFLKTCLHQAYVSERHFYGGRGPASVQGEKFSYTNKIEMGWFHLFEGIEEIHNHEGKLFGYHWYRGMCFSKNDPQSDHISHFFGKKK